MSSRISRHTLRYTFHGWDEPIQWISSSDVSYCFEMIHFWSVNNITSMLVAKILIRIEFIRIIIMFDFCVIQFWCLQRMYVFCWPCGIWVFRTQNASSRLTFYETIHKVDEFEQGLVRILCIKICGWDTLYDIWCYDGFHIWPKCSEGSLNNLFCWWLVTVNDSNPTWL